MIYVIYMRIILYSVKCEQILTFDDIQTLQLLGYDRIPWHMQYAEIYSDKSQMLQ